MSRRSVFRVLFAAAALVAAPSAAIAGASPAIALEGLNETVEILAEESEEAKRSPWHRFKVSGHAMVVADFTTRLRLTANNSGVGTQLYLEELLGLDEDASLWRIEAQYRINRRHMLTLSFFDVRRTGDRSIGSDITIGDEVFPAGAEVETNLETQITKLNYWWNFASGDIWEAGLGTGIYWMQLKAGFSGVLVTPAAVDDLTVEESVRVDLPPPLLGLRGAVAFTDRLRLEALAEVLLVPVNPYRGWILNVRIGLEWDVLDFAGVSLGYEYFDMGVSAPLDRVDVEFSYTYTALLGGLYFYF